MMNLCKFQFHTGSIKSVTVADDLSTHPRFNSILVRLKGFMKAVVILYAILTGRVKTIFMIVVFKVALLSTYSRVNSLGG